MYQIVEELLHFEFGFYYSSEGVEVIAINHSTSQVRTLGFCTTAKDAIFILETCIQFGFHEKGMVFERIPGYRLEWKLEPVLV